MVRTQFNNGSEIVVQNNPYQVTVRAKTIPVAETTSMRWRVIPCTLLALFGMLIAALVVIHFFDVLVRQFRAGTHPTTHAVRWFIIYGFAMVSAGSCFGAAYCFGRLAIQKGCGLGRGMAPLFLLAAYFLMRG